MLLKFSKKAPSAPNFGRFAPKILPSIAKILGGQVQYCGANIGEEEAAPNAPSPVNFVPEALNSVPAPTPSKLIPEV